MAEAETIEARVIRLEERNLTQERQLEQISKGVSRIEDFLTKFPCNTNSFRLNKLEEDSGDLSKRVTDVEHWQYKLGGKLTVIAAFAAFIATILSTATVQILFK